LSLVGIYPSHFAAALLITALLFAAFSQDGDVDDDTGDAGRISGGEGQGWRLACSWLQCDDGLAATCVRALECRMTPSQAIA
jgi:hypothetical protein